MDRPCLCCEKPIEGNGPCHPACLKRLFNKPQIPAISFGWADIPIQIVTVGNRTSISGVQMKASVRLDAEKWSLEIVSTGGTHILKPEHPHFPELPQKQNH